MKRAYAEYRKQYLKTTGKAIFGGIGLGLGASFFIGIRGLGLGLRGAQHALEDTTLPFVGRLLKAGYGAVQLALSVASSLGRPSNKLLRMIGS